MVPNTFVFLNLCELRERTDLRGEDVPALRGWSLSCTSSLGRAGHRQAGSRWVRVRQHCLCLPEQMKTIQCLVFNFNKFNIQNYMLKIKI